MITQKTNPIDAILKKAAEMLARPLTEAMTPGVNAEVSLSFHFHDGALNHIREAREDRHEFQPDKVAGERFRDVPKILKDAIYVLKTRLEACLCTGYHGVIVLSFVIGDGCCDCVTCSNDRVHKVQGGR